MKPNTNTNNQQQHQHAATTILGKRKKTTEKRTDYLHKWVEAQASYRPELYQTEGMPMLPVMAPPLYTIPPPDPAIYRYPVHYQSSFNNMPPPFNPYNYYDFSNNDKDYLKNRRIKTAKHRNNLRHSTRGGTKTDNVDHDESGRVEDEFTSLPVITRQEQQMQNIVPEEDNDRRRYSDPGLAQDGNTESSNSENSDSEDSKAGYHGNKSIIMCLIQQIKLLNENNMRLHKELYETKGELENLKQQMAVWNSDAASRHSSQVGHNIIGGMQNGIHSGSSAIYSPGMLSDLVREIRDAARVREEAMYNKMKMLFEEKTHANKINGNIQFEKNMTDWKNVDQFKGHSKDKSNTNDRIAKIEDELQYLRINQSRDEYLPSPSSGVTLTTSNVHQQSSSPHQQPVLEHERRRLKMELNEEKLARNKAETNVHKLEMLVTQLRSMLGSNNSMTSNGGGVGSSASPVDPLNMVLGPVTDL